ncbi:MAG: flavin reductase family protein [Actinomycetota bacterium]|nr:flavin reductase family protein [Actinomycetota bacterium]
MGRFVTGVTVVTALEDGVPVGFTCQSFVPLSLSPPLVALASAKTSTSWPRMAASGSFCVNVLGRDQVDLAEAFAVSGGDKFAGVAWGRAATGAPVLEGAVAYVDCSLVVAHDAGDHELVVGRVVDTGWREAPPLVYYRGRYTGLGEHAAP